MTRPTSLSPPADALDVRRTFVIIATAYVTPPPRSDDPPYFEIIVGPDLAKYAARTVLRTRDATLYAQALAAEGTEARFVLSWKSRRVAARTVLELDVLAPESAS